MKATQLPLILGVNNEYLFSNFIEQDNSVVVTLFKSLKFEPFVYLWGEIAAGKSHLVSALVHLGSQKQIKIMQINASTLSQEALLNMLPKLDVLIVEDVHKIAGILDSELSFFNLYNFCQQKQIKLIVSSRCSPKSEIWQLADLRSRINSGQTFHVKALRGDAAFDLFFSMMKQRGMQLDKPTERFVQVHCASKFSQLYGLMKKINSLSLSAKKKVTIPLLKQAINEIKA